MKELLEYRRDLIERYAAQPEALYREIAPFPSEDLHVPLERGGWSPHQIVAHIQAVELGAYLPRLLRLLEGQPGDDPVGGRGRIVLEDFDAMAWMTERYDPDVPLQDYLEAFDRGRAQGMTLIGDLPSGGWNRSGFHPTLGERTLQWWVERSVAHVDEHLAQLGG